jgi:hypothetical protein
MRNFQLVASGIDVLPVMLELQRQPELWDQNSARRTYEVSPHKQTSDIWARWRDIDTLDDNKPHELKFLPAWYALPSLRQIVFPLMARCSAIQLGAIFLTRIPAGGEVLPHNDGGGWHSEWFNTKIYTVLQGNNECVNFAEGESVVMLTGTAWMFRNTVIHSVTNAGTDDRISLITCLRCES